MDAYKRTRHEAKGSTSFRLVNKIIIDEIVRMTLTIASETKRPVQFHTGFGKISIKTRQIDIDKVLFVLIFVYMCDTDLD